VLPYPRFPNAMNKAYKALHSNSMKRVFALCIRISMTKHHPLFIASPNTSIQLSRRLCTSIFLEQSNGFSFDQRAESDVPLSQLQVHPDCSTARECSLCMCIRPCRRVLQGLSPFESWRVIRNPRLLRSSLRASSDRVVRVDPVDLH